MCARPGPCGPSAFSRAPSRAFLSYRVAACRPFQQPTTMLDLMQIPAPPPWRTRNGGAEMADSEVPANRGFGSSADEISAVSSLSPERDIQTRSRHGSLFLSSERLRWSDLCRLPQEPSQPAGCTPVHGQLGRGVVQEG